MWQYSFVLSYSFAFYESKYRQLLGLDPSPAEDNEYGVIIHPAICVVNHGFMVEKLDHKYVRISSTRYYKTPEPHVIMRAPKYFKKGEEIVYTYNEITNIHALFQYGFVVRKNPYDTFSIIIEKSDIPCHDKSMRLKNGSCEFKIKPNEVSYDALEHLLRYYYDDENYELLYHPIGFPTSNDEVYFYAAFSNYRYFVKSEINEVPA
jgi:hypothetical protein